ncbi:hypothetical protein KFK09_002420 [Dendrobium nobile]|uniref:Uncharacterized protein n=1 Tax=Dendrobium nobile TaxID=94219 RepID=A0A8T3C3N4_DENNO|nr:hypothetical protein KFK09_002420 [Dendrobium nobile]
MDGDSELRERQRGGTGNTNPVRGQVKKVIAKELYQAIFSSHGGGSRGGGGSDRRQGGQGGGRDGVAGN